MQNKQDNILSAEQVWQFLLLVSCGTKTQQSMPVTENAQALSLLDLYWDLAQQKQWVVAHLGQTLDGRIATESGVSKYITGEANLEHAHRMRALADAVVVGCHTVGLDDPKLTTRRVEGSHPTRVVLDPNLSLISSYSSRSLFVDSSVPTLILCSGGANTEKVSHLGFAEVLEIDCSLDSLEISPQRIISVLQDRGLNRIFIEGGGVTVSRFLQANMLNRLQITVAPILLGSGRPAITLPVIDDLQKAIRGTVKKRWMGDDVFFELML